MSVTYSGTNCCKVLKESIFVFQELWSASVLHVSRVSGCFQNAKAKTSGCSAGLEVTILGSNDFYSFRKQVGQALKQLSVSHQGVMIFAVYGRFASFFTV